MCNKFVLPFNRHKCQSETPAIATSDVKHQSAKSKLNGTAIRAEKSNKDRESKHDDREKRKRRRKHPRSQRRRPRSDGKSRDGKRRRRRTKRRRSVLGFQCTSMLIIMLSNALYYSISCNVLERQTWIYSFIRAHSERSHSRQRSRSHHSRDHSSHRRIRSESRSRSRDSRCSQHIADSLRERRSPSIRRRRGSPSHLDRRRITRCMIVNFGVDVLFQLKSGKCCIMPTCVHVHFLL